MKTAKLSARQQEALDLVRQGRVQYGHEFPKMARRGHATFPVFLIDGYAAYNQQGRTFGSLEERGMIVVRYDLVPHHHVPETTRISRTLTGESTVTIPAHDAPVDAGWRTVVELAAGAEPVARN
ncbi:hypothetical protein QN239_33095 [Mycolicibacterium sp. Y3]